MNILRGKCQERGSRVEGKLGEDGKVHLSRRRKEEPFLSLPWNIHHKESWPNLPYIRVNNRDIYSMSGPPSTAPMLRPVLQSWMWVVHTEL